jgi:phosphatidylglycerophosphatase A
VSLIDLGGKPFRSTPCRRLLSSNRSCGLTLRFEPGRNISTLEKIILFFATGAGTGYSPIAPGTVGTLLAIPFSIALNRTASISLPIALLTLLAFIGVATWFCEKGEAILGEKDSGKIVIDEIAGFLLANFCSPLRLGPVFAAFFLFRLFDIIKPFPARRAEQIPGGLGVISDDLVAGLYAFLILRLLIFGNIP